MKQKKGLVLRDVCGEKVIIGEGLEAIDFGRLLCLNDTAAWLWEKANVFVNKQQIPSHWAQFTPHV